MSFQLEIPQPDLYLSSGDEEAFFNWIKSIKFVKMVEGRTGYLILHVTGAEPDDTSLRELLAVMTRYNLEMSSLQSLCNERNEAWFKDPGKYWYERVFGGG